MTGKLHPPRRCRNARERVAQKIECDRTNLAHRDMHRRQWWVEECRLWQVVHAHDGDVAGNRKAFLLNAEHGADGQAVVLAYFESPEAARRNSERPEQHQWWMETSKLFAGDVTFHDCSEIHELGAGVPDQAGFVQVIQGRCLDVQRARELLGRMNEPMRAARPDVVGGMVCMHDGGDGRFTQAVYFTSETEARQGERRELPPQARTLFEEQMSILTDLVYHDLTEPWMYAR